MRRGHQPGAPTFVNVIVPPRVTVEGATGYAPSSPAVPAVPPLVAPSPPSPRTPPVPLDPLVVPPLPAALAPPVVPPAADGSLPVCSALEHPPTSPLKSDAPTAAPAKARLIPVNVQA